MKLIIDEEIIQKNELSLYEFLMALAIKLGIDFTKTLESLSTKEVIIKDPKEGMLITSHWADIIDDIILSSDSSMPTTNSLDSLAGKMMAIMPQIKKEGTKYYFKCNKREIILKLKKFFKLYGQYSDDQILEATQRYVSSFNGNYSFMRILKYFILKDERKQDSEGNTYVDEVSELATFLENKNSSLSESADNGELI